MNVSIIHKLNQREQSVITLSLKMEILDVIKSGFTGKLYFEEMTA